MKDFGFKLKKKVGQSSIQSSLYPLYAKSANLGNITLTQHLLEAARMSLTISTRLAVNNRDHEKMAVNSFIAGLFHDIGKAAVGFQNMIGDGKIRRWPNNGVGGNRHEILSAAILMLSLGELDRWTKHPEELRAIYLSVVVHHKPFRKYGENFPKPIPEEQWFDGVRFLRMYEELYANKKLLEKTWTEIIEFLGTDEWSSGLIRKGYLTPKLNIVSPNDVKIELESVMSGFTIPGYINGLIFSDKYNSNVTPQEKISQIILRSITTVGDHLSSGQLLSLPPTPYFTKIPLFRDKSLKPSNFQERCGKIKESTMLRAPTGSGKTEAALNWIRANQFVNENEKLLGRVFYVLPYQASLNAMFLRINGWIGVESGSIVGLHHSRAADSLFSILEEELHNNSSQSESKEEIDKFNIPTIIPDKFSTLIYSDEIQATKSNVSVLAKNLARLCRESYYPVKLTTPHQLLKAILQGRGWEIILMDMMNSVIVFDEIHTYDASMTGLILGLSKLLIDRFQVKIFFMSATFPNFLINLIKKHIDKNIPFIELNPDAPSDKKRLEVRRHRVKVSDQSMLDTIKSQQFLSKLQDNDTLLIVCNTVVTAQKVYAFLKPLITDKYGSNSIILFHSRFRIQDRQIKERKIIGIKDEKIKVVVATQVVEVSLDIDLSYGVFECAPLDALVQRFGRVNRKGKRQFREENILITLPGKYNHLIYDKAQTEYTYELLRNNQGKLMAEKQLVALINKLYDKHGWSENQVRYFNNAFNHPKFKNFDNEIFPGSYRYWIDDVLDGNTTIDVLLGQDEEKYNKLLKKHEYLESNRLLVPARVAKKYLDTSDKRKPPVLRTNYHYSSELGLTIQRSGQK